MSSIERPLSWAINIVLYHMPASPRISSFNDTESVQSWKLTESSQRWAAIFGRISKSSPDQMLPLASALFSLSLSIIHLRSAECGRWGSVPSGVGRTDDEEVAPRTRLATLTSGCPCYRLPPETRSHVSGKKKLFEEKVAEWKFTATDVNENNVSVTAGWWGAGEGW